MTPALAAHARLLRRLPVRAHVCRDESDPHIFGIAVIVRGVRYASINRARIALRCNVCKIHAMLETGEAQYA